MSILNTYRPLIDINPAKASLLDQSGNGYNAVASGTVKWSKTSKKNALTFGANGLLTITRDATLDAIEDFTILVFGEVPAVCTGNSLHIFNKGSQYQLYWVPSTGALALFSGVTDSSSGVDIRGARMIGVSFNSGQNPLFYKNGAFIGSGNNVLTPTTNSTNVGIGNYLPSPVDTFNAEGKFYRVLFFNQVLPGEAISQIYDELMAEQGAGDPKTTNFKGFPPPIDSNCVLAYDMVSRTGDGKMADLSGAGHHGTIVAGISSSVLPSGYRGMSMNNVLRGIHWTAFSLGTSHTFEIVIKPDETEFEVLEESGNAYGLYITPTGTTAYYAAGGVAVTWTITALANKETHFVIDRSNTTVNLYINGVSQGEQTLSANNDLLTFTNLNSGSALYSLNGQIGYVQVYSTSKGATWATNRYRQYAKKVIYDAQAEYWTPTLANVTAGRIGNTEFSVLSGTYKVSEELVNGRKKAWIENVVAGVASMPFDKAYGTWLFEANKTGAAGVIDIMFIADTNDVATAATQDGYQLRINGNESVQMNESIAGTQTTRMYTGNSYIALSTSYLIAVTRAYDGTFTFYIKGGAYTNWRLITATGNPIVDNTSTITKWMTADLDAGDKFRFIRHYQGVLDLSTLPI